MPVQYLILHVVPLKLNIVSHSGNYVSTVSHIACGASEVEHSLDTVPFLPYIVLMSYHIAANFQEKKTFVEVL